MKWSYEDFRHSLIHIIVVAVINIAGWNICFVKTGLGFNILLNVVIVAAAIIAAVIRFFQYRRKK